MELRTLIKCTVLMRLALRCDNVDIRVGPLTCLTMATFSGSPALPSSGSSGGGGAGVRVKTEARIKQPVYASSIVASSVVAHSKPRYVVSIVPEMGPTTSPRANAPVLAHHERHERTREAPPRAQAAA
jgi:hypothetical protein